MERDPLGVEGAVASAVITPNPMSPEKGLEPILEGETVIQSVSGRNFDLSKLKQTNVVLYLRFNLSDSRAAQDKHIEDRVKEAGLEMVKLRLKGDDYGRLLEEWMMENDQKPTAVLKWDEHGGIFGSMKRHRKLAKWCHQNKIAPISVDFAYLDHYGGYMMNLLEESGDTTIKRDFTDMGDNWIELKDIKGKVGSYIKRIKKIYDYHRFYKKLGHVKPTYKYAAYTQSLMNGCRLMQKNKPEEWMRHLDDLFGSDLIFKTQPSPFVKKDESFDSLNVVNHKADWIKKTRGITDVGIEMNAAVAVHADCIIINSSGVSSEFVLNNIPVVATGKSWFSGLNIFHEPKDWQDLKMIIKSGRYKIGPTQKKMRKKWITWWIQHQFLKEDPSTVMKDIIKDFYDRKG